LSLWARAEWSGDTPYATRLTTRLCGAPIWAAGFWRFAGPARADGRPRAVKCRLMDGAPQAARVACCRCVEFLHGSFAFLPDLDHPHHSNHNRHGDVPVRSATPARRPRRQDGGIDPCRAPATVAGNSACVDCPFPPNGRPPCKRGSMPAMARRPSSKRSFGAMAMACRISAVHKSKRNAHAVPAALGTSSGFRFSSRPMAAPYLKQIGIDRRFCVWPWIACDAGRKGIEIRAPARRRPQQGRASSRNTSIFLSMAGSTFSKTSRGPSTSATSSFDFP
jgi:hypothetical protein